jgi:hypothetical protein
MTDAAAGLRIRFQLLIPITQIQPGKSKSLCDWRKTQSQFSPPSFIAPAAEALAQRNG